MRRLAPSLLLVLALVAGACAQTVTTYDDLGTFTGVRISSAFDVDLVRGDAHVAVISVPDQYADRIAVDVVDDVLVVEVKRGSSLKMRRGGKLEATITLPLLTQVDVSGAVTLRSDDTWQGEELALQASGASDIELDLEVESLAIAASGASDVELEGRAVRLVVEASGASDVEAEDVEADEVIVSSSGASDVSVYAAEALTATASGGSDIRYVGGAERVSVQSSSGSDITKG